MLTELRTQLIAILTSPLKRADRHATRAWPDAELEAMTPAELWRSRLGAEAALMLWIVLAAGTAVQLADSSGWTILARIILLAVFVQATLDATSVDARLRVALRQARIRRTETTGPADARIVTARSPLLPPATGAVELWIDGVLCFTLPPEADEAWTVTEFGRFVLRRTY